MTSCATCHTMKGICEGGLELTAYRTLYLPLTTQASLDPDRSLKLGVSGRTALADYLPHVGCGMRTYR
jgi:hypothetical protein